MKTIIITGSVGTGKTTLSKKLARGLNFLHLNVDQVIHKYNLSEGYDAKRKAKIIDVKRLSNTLVREINIIKKNKKIQGIIIDSHLSHYLPAKYVDLCIVAKCNLKILSKRLKKRKYPVNKIRENLDAEIFYVCLNEAKERKHNIIIIDTSKGINIDDYAEKITFSLKK